MSEENLFSCHKDRAFPMVGSGFLEIVTCFVEIVTKFWKLSPKNVEIVTSNCGIYYLINGCIAVPLRKFL